MDIHAVLLVDTSILPDDAKAVVVAAQKKQAKTTIQKMYFIRLLPLL